MMLNRYLNLSSLLRIAYEEPLTRDYMSVIYGYSYPTYVHSLNVGFHAALMCIEMRLKKEHAIEITRGAYLHDIGKLTIPLTILDKKGGLTAGEYNIIKTHVRRDYVAVNSEFSDIVNDIIYMHHERIDGSGYPLGLKGEELPLHSRIAMVADSYSAMTEKRPYGIIYSSEGAIQELKTCGGFDIACVESLERAIDEYDPYKSATFDTRAFVKEAVVSCF